MVDSPETRLRDGSGEVVATTEARQGVTGTGTRYVLHIGLALAVIALVIVYFVMLR
jgi:hypothetical protein